MTGSFDHPALVYRTAEEFLEPMVPFVVRGVEREEPVFVAVGPEELAALRGAVGDGAVHVRWHDTREWHPHPATRLRAIHVFVSDAMRSGAARVRLVGEPLWPARPPELAREWARYEAALNAVLAPFPITLVCTYDASRLAPDVVADAARTHPVLGLDPSRRSRDYEDPASLVARWTADLVPPPPDATVSSDPTDPASVRAFVGDHARRAGLPADRVHDLELAVDEVVTNALVHGGGDTTVRTWLDDGHVICQVDDHGPGVPDALAGYRPPGPDHVQGRGLWITRQVVDLLEVVSTPTGTSVRVRMRVAP
ncbi:MAG TPA: sensor histidine kinase [Actinomycetota bacterium]